MATKRKVLKRPRLRKLTNPTITQLHRIVGQLNAVERMIKEDKDEKQIVTLIDAATSSLRSLRNNFIRGKIRGKLAQELDTLLALVDK